MIKKSDMKRIKAVRLLILDVDGVMTDGRIIYDDAGREEKNFDVQDGHGIKLLMRAGVDVALLTSRESGVVRHRASNLGISIVYQGYKEKLQAFNDILGKKALRAEEVAVMGDDLVDLPVMKRAGFSIAVKNAVPEVKKMARYVTRSEGGRGAVREAVELILKAQGKWAGVLEYYMK